jgi:thiamine-phosphate pyrophosphorylase
MSSKRKWLKKYRLCVVVNRPFFKDSRDLVKAVQKISAAGKVIIQLRDKISDKSEVFKTALAIKKVLRKSSNIFIVNDHADIAKLANADGVHLGTSDLPLAAARKLLGRGKIIGCSCANLKQVLLGQDQGADYLGLGAIFSTATKPESAPLGLSKLKALKNKIKIPIFAIGGINETNIKEVLSLGVQGVAISSAICKASDKVLATRRLLNILNS